MTLDQLIAEFRIRADDRAEPYLFGDDARVGALLVEAENEACERARLLQDHTTDEICHITMLDGVTEYLLDERVLDVTHARLNGANDALRRMTEDVLPDRCGQPDAAGEPRAYSLTGFPDQLTLTLDRPVDLTKFDTLNLTVFRLPLAPMTDNDAPEIARRFHMRLLSWSLFLAFDGRDTDTGDMQRAAGYKARFEEDFGERRSAQVQRKQMRHRPNLVKPDGVGAMGRRIRPYRPSVES